MAAIIGYLYLLVRPFGKMRLQTSKCICYVDRVSGESNAIGCARLSVCLSVPPSVSTRSFEPPAQSLTSILHMYGPRPQLAWN